MGNVPELTPPEKLTELVPLEVIRTETVLSRLPVHNLAKKGKVEIHIVRKNERGEVTLNWEVSYNEKYGQPRQLSYKLDTLVLNKYLDELPRPLPKIIRLGTLRSIGEQLGIPANTQSIKKAFHQNAGAYITAKLTYKGSDGEKHLLEAGFTRYSLVFTGESLPGGAKADAVYVILHEPYWQVLNNAPDRPLDYSYLKALSSSPSAQRFYELLSYRMFSAIKYQHPRARMLYSDYCTAAPQLRYYESDPVKKQMYKIHRVHKDSQYLAKVNYQPTLDSEGKPDWIMWYVPGPRALAQYKAFRNKTRVEAEDASDYKELGEINNTTAGEKTGPRPLPPQIPNDAGSEQALALVRYFYSLFHKIQDVTPQSKELEHAERLIRDHGIAKAKHIVLFAHKAAPETNFVPATFGGVIHYVGRALADFAQRRQARQTAQVKAQQQQQEERQLQEERERRTQLQARYQSLPPEERARLQEQAKTNLLQQGYKPETMFGAVVNSEIYRLMETKETT
jgi:hypothetical protein